MSGEVSGEVSCVSGEVSGELSEAENQQQKEWDYCEARS